MSTIIDLGKCTQPSSKKIVDTIYSEAPKEIDEDALKIILFATEEGLGCRETAEKIARSIENSTNIRQNFFEIIEDLNLNSYFHPTPEISGLIRSYLERMKSHSGNKKPLFREISSLGFEE